MSAGISALGQSCPTAPLQQQAAEIAHVRQQLRSIKLSDDGMDTEVPAEAKTGIVTLKDDLVRVADAVAACTHDPKAVESALALLLQANALEPPLDTGVSNDDHRYDEWRTFVYGANLQIHAVDPDVGPIKVTMGSGLMALTMSTNIPCGRDEVLLLYALSQGHWKRTLRWQAKPYDQISGAFGDTFLYTVVAGRDPGELRVAVAHGTPWCTSRFSGIHMDVLAPAANGEARVVWHADRGLSRGDFENRMRATADGFELHVHAPALDADGYERTVVYRYKVAGDTVERTGPIATNGRGFVEEWLSMPWDEAKNVTAPEAVAAVKPLHDKVAKAKGSSETYIGYEYGPVRGCSVKGQYEVQMDATPGGSQFFRLQEGSAGYVLIGFGTAHDARCDGRDVMKGR